MKKILKIICITGAVIFLNSCIWGDKGEGIRILPETRALMEVELVKGGAEAHDLLYSVRYIVFDNASTSPKLDLNELLAVGEDARESTVFKTTLEVNCNPDKMVIVVVNEPTGATPVLENATSPAVLEDLMFNMSNVFNYNHSAPSSTGLPMTGVKRDIAVTEENHSGNPLPVSMTAERTAARIDFYLKTEDESTSAWMTYDSGNPSNSTKAILEYTHSTGYLIAGTRADETRYQEGADAAKNFGHMLTVAPPDSYKGWYYSNTTDTHLDTDPLLVCSFYTPERTCRTVLDKLYLHLDGLRTSTGIKRADVTLDRFSDENGIEQVLDTIKRNYIYEITGIVKEEKVSFEHKVIPWVEAGTGVIIDPQYYLRVSHDYIYLLNDGEQTFLTAETNYDREDDDRGFPKGIRVGTIAYYTKAGIPVTSGNLYGWLTAQPGGADGDLTRNIRLTVSGTIGDSDKGCYATVTITAGNTSKLVRVIRM